MLEATVRAQMGNAAFDAKKDDAGFKEKLKRTSVIMAGEFSVVVSPFEEKLREAYAAAYSRQFNEAELSQILDFYQTPVGMKFAQRAISMITDPEVTKLQREIAPAVTDALPGIMAKVKAATADLVPPPPKPVSAPDSDEE